MNFMLDPAMQEFYSEQSTAMSPLAKAWGRKGATRCDFENRRCLRLAYRRGRPPTRAL